MSALTVALVKRVACSAAIRMVTVVLTALAARVAFAADIALPPRGGWRATSSSVEAPAIASKFAIDGDETTRWGGAFSPGHWLQVDLGRTATLGGVRIHWDSAFAAAYRIELSTDGSGWHTAFETSDATGDVDYAFFAPEPARYVRLASPDRTADWGVSLFEFEPLAAAVAPRLEGFADGQVDPWRPGPPHPLRRSRAGDYELRMRFPRPLPAAGLEVEWGAPRLGARLQARGEDERWILLADDPGSLGDSSYLAARQATTLRELRLSVRAAERPVPAIRRLRLLSPGRAMTPMKEYEIAAARAHRELFPASLHAQQVYWTVVGIPAGVQKTIFSEFGDVEAFRGAPLVQPVWRDRAGRAAAAYDHAPAHSLRDGWLPLPAVEWSPQPGLTLRSEALAVEQDGAPVTLVRYRLRNAGEATIEGRLALVVRPMQMNPPWQNGGLSPIRAAAIEGESVAAAVRINGRTLLQSLTPVGGGGAAPFGAHGATEITQNAAAGSVPPSRSARDDDGLAAALLAYDVRLAPGAQRDIVVAFPLGSQRVDVRAPAPAPPLDLAALGVEHDASAGFDALASQVAQRWQQRVGRVGVSLPDRSLVDMLHAQAAYMLINQTGPALQAGPRNYDRSFIRDGSATAVALLRLGDARTARDYLAWYAAHAVHENGLVSPILNEDGSVNRGFGSDIEYDSQGEFVWLVAEIARLDGGAASVREYLPAVKRTLSFLQLLRERTLVPGYQADREAPERFRGIIAPSISHEGYSTPTHSYWDDYWALKGWHDGAWLAREWGETGMADWAQQQYAALRESVAASIRATMAWKHGDIIPASADAGDGDPAGVSIALDPCGQQDLLPRDALERTFTRYLDDVRRREAPGSLYAYTPYEIRNILSYVHLDRPADADELLRTLLAGRRPAEWQVLAEVVHSRLRHPAYLGDMPHTWIGSEYVRAIFGMLLQERDDALALLPGTPPAWLAGEGLRIDGLPTAYGKLSMSARQDGNSLQVPLDSAPRAGAVVVYWPQRQRPRRVSVDDMAQAAFDADGIRLKAPFRHLVAEW